MIFKTILFVIFVAAVASGNESDKKITIDSLSILKSPFVHMKNQSQVLEKINGIVSQGTEKLQFVTDFDKTLTKQHGQNNTDTLHSFKIFYKCKQIPEPNLKKINAYVVKYDAAEFDHTIGFERRKQVVEEMYIIDNEQLRGFTFDRREIEEVVRNYAPPIRDRTDELMSRLSDLHVPVIIFSAGLVDVLEEQLRQKNVPYKDVHIIGNRLEFNGTTLNGLQNPGSLINPFNKYEHIIDYISTADLKNRKNIILMGDNIGDASMARGKESEGIVLKIGFSYNQTDDNMKLYKESFDIVLDDDQTMNVILDILKLF